MTGRSGRRHRARGSLLLIESPAGRNQRQGYCSRSGCIDCLVRLAVPVCRQIPGKQIPGGKPWLELTLSKIGKSVGIQGLSSLADNPGGNPAHFLQLLRAASTGSVQNLGQRTIDGLSTTGVRATINLPKVVDTLPASQQPSASSAIASVEKLTGLRYLPIEAWVDSSNHVRRIVLSETGHVEGQPFAEKVQLDFVKYGPEPMPAAPPADEVTNIMSLF